MNLFYTRIALLLFVLSFSYSSFSQTCGFDERHKALLASNPSYKTFTENSKLRLKQLNDHRRLAPNAPLAVVYRIPVVVHIIHKGEAVGVGTNISEAQIQSAILSLTQFYRGVLGSSPDAEIEFELANLDPSCGLTTGIIRIDGSSVASYSTDGLVTGGTGNETAVKNLSKWPNSSYYNIWIVSEINNNNGGGGIQGFAYFPGAPSSVDGAVILYNAFGYDPTNTLGYNLKTATDENKTAIHEMGHAFGLYHSFEGDDANNDGVADQCPLNADCTTDGDEVCDTDPHRRSPSNCPTGANVCGGTLDDIVNNFMDYSSAACQNRFTGGQITRMRDAIALYRPSLTSSRSLNTSYPVTPYAPPVAACTPTTGATGLSGDYAGIFNIGINGVNFSSSTPRLDNISNGYVNWTTECQTLNELVRGGTYLFSATVYAVNQEQLRAWIDYNNNGVFENATEQIYINSAIPNTGTVTVNGNFTIPATATLNTVLRLRVIEELSTVYSLPAISSGCYNPTYGQAEDFHLFLSSALPITLESFTAKKSGADVLLNWQTSFEQNAREFQIEKSGDGINFHQIGTVSATKNSLSSRLYSFIDKTVTLATNYYRLRMVDLDDHFEFSRIVVIKNQLSAKVPFHFLSNPVHNNLDIQFGEIVDGRVQIRLTDITGKLMMTWNGEKVANTRVTINIAGKNLSTGVYLLHARIQGKDYVEKVIIK